MSITVTFVGSAPVVPEVGQDTASFVLNGRILVDCGWHAALEMRRYGILPLDIEALFLTHCHHDHYMGLPMLLFYRAMRGKDRPPLRIYGPAEELEEVVELSRRFLRPERFPEAFPQVELHPLSPGQLVEEGEMAIRTARATHPVPALSYRFEDRSSGAVVAYSGDTGYEPSLAMFFRDADLLIHEASLAPGQTDRGGYGHASPEEAARIARDAGAERLALIHYLQSNGEAILTAARSVFVETVLAEEGLILRIAT
ncbi:MAG: MBL fold metallo-hydrolase [Armatimonadetes bacterium]|nr:MBL fold metallo-hydrolase [Armatimonadota bacterium]